jgi:hypothetical protein
MPLYNNASAVCTPMENAAVQFSKGAVVRQIVQRSKELRVECDRAGTPMSKWAMIGTLAYQPRPEPSILSARHDHTKAKRSDPRTTLGRVPTPDPQVLTIPPCAR